MENKDTTILITESEVAEIISSIENAPVDGFGRVSRNRNIHTAPFKKLVNSLNARLYEFILTRHNMAKLQNEMPLVAKSILNSSDFFSPDGEEMYVSIGKFNRTPIIGEEFVAIVQGGDKSSYIVHYRVLELDGDYAVCKLIGSEQLGVDEERFSSVEAIAQQNTSDIEGLRQDIINESHFRGYLLTNADVQALAGNANDYAYSAESGTKWIFHPAPMRWIDSGVPVPNQSVPASDSSPLMDGEPSAGQEGAYSRADHRHPSDTSKVNKAGDEMTGPLTIGEKWADGITFKEYLKLQKDGIEIGHTGEEEYAGVTREKIYTKDVAITGEGIALSVHDDSVYGEDRILHFPEPRIHEAEESDPYTYYHDETIATEHFVSEAVTNAGGGGTKWYRHTLDGVTIPEGVTDFKLLSTRAEPYTSIHEIQKDYSEGKTCITAIDGGFFVNVNRCVCVHEFGGFYFHSCGDTVLVNIVDSGSIGTDVVTEYMEE